MSEKKYPSQVKWQSKARLYVNDDTHEILKALKLNLGVKTMPEVVDYLIDQAAPASEQVSAAVSEGKDNAI